MKNHVLCTIETQFSKTSLRRSVLHHITKTKVIIFQIAQKTTIDRIKVYIIISALRLYARQYFSSYFCLITDN